MSKKYYAYFLIDDKETGILESWDKCKQLVANKRSRYKSFKSYDEAKEWLNSGAEYLKKETIKKNLEANVLDKNAIYFDAGTGRGTGVEARVTDFKGNSLLSEILPYDINEFGNIHLGNDVTNNFGELMALSLAIEIANKKNIKNIYGDSNLVIKYWSQGKFHPEKLQIETVNLIKRVIMKRLNFEKLGGKISHISGDFNPADLGFHK